MAAKRPSPGEGGPATKKPLLMQSPLIIPPATSQEDLDMKVLQVLLRSSGCSLAGNYCYMLAGLGSREVT